MSAPGEVYLADLGMVAKIRPVLIVSADDPGAARNLFTFVPLTAEMRGGPYEVPVPKTPWLDKRSVANVQGINSMDKWLGKINVSPFMTGEGVSLSHRPQGEGGTLCLIRQGA